MVFSNSTRAKLDPASWKEVMPLARHSSTRQLDHLPQGGLIGLAVEVGAHQILGGLAQHPDGAAVGIANDLAARRVGSVIGDPADLERRRVDHGGVPAGVDEDDGLSGDTSLRAS